ncbi:MAG TPA: hypothetical protein V6D12_14165 [Candidatus Obscuribacterales bacterium]
MPKKALSIFLALMVISTLAFAQSARNPQYDHAGKSNFTNLSVTGLDVTGNRGYIELVSPDERGDVFSYYLWVDSDGKLRVASYATVSAFSSFPTGNLNLPEFCPNCTIVGNQS